METQSANILNLLLGIVPTQTNPVGGSVASHGETTPFDLIFGSLLGNPSKGKSAVDSFLTQIANTDKTNLPQAVPSFATDFKALLDGRAVPDAPSTLTNVSDVFGNYLYGQGDGDNDGDGDDIAFINRQTAPLGGGAVETDNPFAKLAHSGGGAVDIKALMALMPNAPVAASDLNALPIDLPQGNYRILDWSVSNGNLNLQIAPADGTAGTVNVDSAIRVSLPLNALNLSPETAQLVNPNGWQRFDLDGSSDQSKLLAKAFEAVNLKELKIEIANPSAVKAAVDSAQPMQLSLIGENVGQEVALRATINRNQIRARLDGDSKDIAGSKPDTFMQALDKGETRTVVTAQQAILGGRTGADSGLLRETTVGGFELFSKATDTNKTNMTQPADQATVLPDFAKSMHEVTLDRTQQSAVPTRFIMPDDIRTTLKPGGQSVQLRLDPEHLGPARLSLHVHNDHLRASVLVDSQQAKQAVEGSIDRLVQALARADIKVDYINVTVDPNASREQLFDRQPRWARAARSGRFFDLENESAGIASAAPVSYRSGGGYVGAGGVNVLA